MSYAALTVYVDADGIPVFLSAAVEIDRPKTFLGAGR